MTIIIAANLKNKSVLVSDTQVTTDDFITKSVGKIVEFDNFLVGYTGDLRARSILIKLADSGFKIKNELDAIRFKEKFFKMSKGDIECELLVLTRKGLIFDIDKHSVVEYDKYHSIGAGSPYSLGVLHSLYPNENCIVKAMQAAYEFSASCGGEICIREV